MMTRRLVYTIPVLLLALFAASCSDDDCPECPTPDAGPSLYALGTMAMDGIYFNTYIEVFDVTSAGTDIDSVLVDEEFGHCCVRDYHQITAQDGRQVVANLGSETCPSGGPDGVHAR